MFHMLVKVGADLASCVLVPEPVHTLKFSFERRILKEEQDVQEDKRKIKRPLMETETVFLPHYSLPEVFEHILQI